jgi:hypothetical protein
MIPASRCLSRSTTLFGRALESLFCSTNPFSSSPQDAVSPSLRGSTAATSRFTDSDSDSSSHSPTSASNVARSASNAPLQHKVSGRSQGEGSNVHLIIDSHANIPLKSSEYASSHDDIFGVQRNWFTALYKQLNYMNNTGMVQGTFKGRQRQVSAFLTAQHGTGSSAW